MLRGVSNKTFQHTRGTKCLALSRLFERLFATVVALFLIVVIALLVAALDAQPLPGVRRSSYEL